MDATRPHRHAAELTAAHQRSTAIDRRLRACNRAIDDQRTRVDRRRTRVRVQAGEREHACTLLGDCAVSFDFACEGGVCCVSGRQRLAGRNLHDSTRGPAVRQRADDFGCRH